MRNVHQGRLLFAAVFVASFTISGCTASPEDRAARDMKRGRELMDQKDFSRAQLEFRNAVRETPKNADAHYHLGLALVQAGLLSEALGALRTATDLDPKHTQAQLKLAEVMLSSRKTETLQEAATRLQGVLAEFPGNVDAIDRLANAEFRLGKPEEAIKRLEDSLKKFPANLHAAVTLARAHLAKRDVIGAERILKQAAAEAPESASAARALGQLYLLIGQPGKAEPELKKAVRLDPMNSSALADLAMLQVNGKRLDEAEQTYKMLAALPDGEYRLIHAQFQYQRGQKEEAHKELRAILAKDPDARGPRTQLFNWLLAENKVTEAGDLLTSALKRNPKDNPALYQRSLLSLRSAKIEEATADLQHVLQMTPDAVQAHFALAAVYEAQGSTQNERAQLNEVLRLDSNHLPARIALSRNLLKSNQADGALLALDAAPKSQKGSLEWTLSRNWALLAKADVKQLRALLNQQLAIDRNEELVLQDALVRSMEKDHSGARASADEVLRRNPEEVRAAVVLASSYVALGQPLKAEERLRDLVGGHPRSAPLQALLGRWYMDHGKPSEARTAYQAAMSANPAFLQADFELAELDRRTNQPAAARKLLESILRADPKYIPAMLMLASLDQKSGNMVAAIARLRRALELDESNVTALTNLAYLRALEDPREAVSLGRKALDLAPGNPDIASTLGWIHYRKGEYQPAIEYLKAAVAADPSPRRQFHLGAAYTKAGQRALGGKLLLEALAKEPRLHETEKGW